MILSERGTDGGIILGVQASGENMGQRLRVPDCALAWSELTCDNDGFAHRAVKDRIVGMVGLIWFNLLLRVQTITYRSFPYSGGINHNNSNRSGSPVN